ncbi:MAG: hypothetical protein R2848_06690 [Thermomicrobiales bacterium]
MERSTPVFFVPGVFRAGQPVSLGADRFGAHGYYVVAGVDEVGRGALAGPLVAAAVIFEPATTDRRSHREVIERCVHDSKIMTRDAR